MIERDRRGRSYETGDITVTFDPRRCIHFAACVRGLPHVFDKKARPWIRPDRAEAETVAAIVRRCPTGALHYTLPNGPDEQPDAQVTVAPQQDGPLFVRGDVIVQTSAGDVRDSRMALCRCGNSGNKPFCDGSHARIGWRSDEDFKE